MKTLSALALLSVFLALPIHAQLFGPAPTDLPQHAFVIGAGVGPTSKDISIIAGYGDKLPTSTATYSYSGMSVIPAFVTQANGSKSLSITPVAHTGLKQMLFQSGRFSLAIDGGAGVSLPTSGTSAFDFAGIAGVDLIWRLNKALNSAGGGTNNYIAIQPQFTQLTGTPGGTVVSIGIAWVHGVNGAQ